MYFQASHAYQTKNSAKYRDKRHCCSDEISAFSSCVVSVVGANIVAMSLDDDDQQTASEFVGKAHAAVNKRAR